MNDTSYIIAKLFSNSVKLISQKENCDEYISEYTIYGVNPSISGQDILSNINTRDKIGIHFYIPEEEDSIDYLSTTDSNWSEFIDELTSEEVKEGKIKIHIEKTLQNNQLSIYNIDKFTEYIESLSLSQFLAVLNNSFSSFLIFEIQDDTYHEWNTSTIAFINNKSSYKIDGIGDINRENRIKEARILCYNETEKYKILPEDLFPVSYDKTNKLQTDFIKACMIYTSSMIVDYSSIKENIYTYKLNGFKTLNGQIDINCLPNIQVDTESCNTVFEIYQWLYLGGKDNDKINIARNIISLNINEKTLETNPATFSAILSNYRIYEKDNIRQYLNVRNKLSELLIDLQEKISGIVDSFIADFKKNILTLLSFFISVIVIRVVSKGDFIGGFTNEIIGLSFVFVFISICMLIYSRWELKRKIELYNKHYKQIKNRYEDILSEIELEDIFEDCDPQNDDSNCSFVNKQKRLYTWVWVLSIVVLVLFLIIVCFINNDISFTSLINKTICFIQNIF